MPRQAISDSQKKALRQWYQRQYPKPRQREVIPWFKKEFNHQISASTVCEILSDRYLFLDQDIPSSSLSSSKHRTANWPILEEILYNWQQIIQNRGGIVTGEILIEKARHIWHQIPEYQNQSVPEFSVGWLAGFKKRYKIQKQNKHGEALSVPESATEEMKSIQTLFGEFLEENIYNMDETGLFWRQSPTSGLATENQPGIKKDKSRLTLVTCLNCTGSDRIPLWIIGQAKVPHSLRGVNIQALGGVWRSNKKAWMNSLIMREWLLSFYSHVGGNRTILLLLDNFRAHIQGLELAPPPSNIRVQFLPANSTSLYQPLDQGIINNLKVYYRKKWLQYMIESYELNLDPISSISLYHAVHWILQAWKYDISNTTVYNCFRKSTVIQSQIQSLPSQPLPDLSTLYTEAQHVGQIREVMSLQNFLNPPNEDMVDLPDNDDLNELISFHLSQNLESEVEPEPEDIPPVQPPSLRQALNSLRTVLLYEEFQEDAQPNDIQYLERLERQLVYQEVAQRTQTTLDGWIR